MSVWVFECWLWRVKDVFYLGNILKTLFTPRKSLLGADGLLVESHCIECTGGEGVYCKTHRLALQGLWGNGLRSDANCN